MPCLLIEIFGMHSHYFEGLKADAHTTELKGFPASAGVYTGRARVMLSAMELFELEDGEILVGGVGDHAARAGEQFGDRGRVHGERVDEADPGGAGELDQCQAGPVGALTVEFGVHGVPRLVA